MPYYNYVVVTVSILTPVGKVPETKVNLLIPVPPGVAIVYVAFA